ncbi:MAG: family 78 glycoside hydrolase catalytic domain [Bacteroidia bacterium]|nr:family 78 glycoside hydrolase catalytic domain [Bacteroidia bacterium]
MKKIITLILVFIAVIFAIYQDSLFAANQQYTVANQDTLLKGAVWITDHSLIPVTDSLFYPDHPAPLMRTEFDIRDDIRKAEMWITAAGYYETWLNGNRLGDQQLDPAWTDFSKRTYVTCMDVTASVRKGMNTWGIMPGNGFYNPLPLKMWGGRNIRNDLPVGKPCAIAKLVITLRDGTRKVYNTSDQWVTRPGPVTRNNVYLGEWFDARKEIPGWTVAGDDRTGWEPVEVVRGPGGKPQLASFPPIRITKWLEPISITMDAKSNQIIDFGQNFAGLIRIQIKAEAGDTIRFRYGELVYPDGTLNPMTSVCGQIKRAGVGGPGAPAIAEQIDVYVAKGGAPEFFQPRFTFHGFRYVEISGLSYNLAKSDLKAGRINSAVAETGKINSSSAYLNKLNSNCQWTFLSNLQSVQSDCPAREKFGYGGDINATAEAYIYNYDMQQIYRKIIYDWVDAMKPDGFVDTAPFVGIEYCGLSWESAFLFLQNALWIHYGDTDLVKEMYRTDQAWMEKIARIHPNLVVDSGLSDHESLAKVPVELIGTCHYYQIARIMARFAEVNGDQAGISRYTNLAEKIRLRIINLFWDNPKIEVPNQQTLLASLLASGVLDTKDQAIAMDRLLRVLKESDYHVTTGIFGTQYLLDVLSSHGRIDIAYRVVNQKGFPGWRYMVDQGATTLWETWKESDNTFSQNHPMFGSVSEWYLKWLGGIQPDPEHPGSTSVLLKPRPVADLDSLSVEKFFPSGALASRWWWKDRNLCFEFSIPEGLKTNWLPESGNKEIRVMKSPEGWNLNRNRKPQGINLGTAGRYIFEIVNAKN